MAYACSSCPQGLRWMISRRRQDTVNGTGGPSQSQNPGAVNCANATEMTAVLAATATAVLWNAKETAAVPTARPKAVLVSVLCKRPRPLAADSSIQHCVYK